MPIYAKFIDPYRGFSGGVTVGAHAGWSRLQTFASARGTSWRPAGRSRAGGVPLHHNLRTK